MLMMVLAVVLAAAAIITPSDSHVAHIHWFRKEHGRHGRAFCPQMRKRHEGGQQW